MLFSLLDLEGIIAEKSHAEPGTSYTRSLLDDGLGRIARKFGEEAVETVVASLHGDRADLTGEAADVLYHLLVLLRAREISVAEVMDVLSHRTRQSGLAEKAARAHR